jgi:hypothetical protein
MCTVLLPPGVNPPAVNKYHHHHHHHKHQGLDPLIRSVSTVTAARANASSVFQLFSFLVVCSGTISKGFSFVAFFASVKASSVCIHLSYLVCLQSVVRKVCSHLFCDHKGCSLPEVSVTLFLPLQYFVFVRMLGPISDPYKDVGKTSVLYIFKRVSVLSFLKIVLLIVPINCKNFVNLNSTSLENW